MKYQCLVFDHDDTVVNSTANVHYPSFCEYMKRKRPQVKVSLQEYMVYNFNPGFLWLLEEFCGLTPPEMKEEYQFWLDYCSSHVSQAFDGIREMMEKQKQSGGLLAVVSHSHKDNILRDYAHNHLPLPDEIFGIEGPKEEWKPSPLPLTRIMEKYRLQPGEMLVIDDLKPGLDMAKAAGVPFCAAGWCFDIPENTKYMKEYADFYCSKVEELNQLCF